MSTSEADANAPPLSATWRRQRLMRLGSTSTIQGRASSPLRTRQHTDPISILSEPQEVSETSELGQSAPSQSYGTMSNPRFRTMRKGSQRSREPSLTRSLHLPRLNITESRSTSNPPSPSYTPSILREYAFSRLSRPISAYDALFSAKDDTPEARDSEMDAKINGIRVWYSSFSSVDWLHDAIKDSVRFSKLRRRKSLRARVRLLFDKSLGWIIVTIVGFLTAIIAFMVVRTEQYLFDLKEGYCLTGWYKAKRFCCPPVDETQYFLPDFTNEVECPAWRSWSEAFSWRAGDTGEQFVQYVAYAVVALLLATGSCLLTVLLTNSTTFITRKESGVLAPDFADTKGEAHAGPKRKVMFYAAGSGIPEVKTILSGFVIHGYLGYRVLFTKAVGLAMSVASGLSLGKEGPFVHIASCVGNIVSRVHTKYENNEAKRREILSAACAAGVAVAFGAPIGGTLFSLEEVSYFFPPKVMWRSFFCAMIAAITLKVLDPFGTGKLVLFQVTYDKDWHSYELFPFLLLGVFGGVYGAYFSKLNYRWSLHVRNGTPLKSHPVAEVILITLITTFLCFLNPFTRLGGTELVYNLFAECRSSSRNNHLGLCVVDRGSFEAVWPLARAILVAMVVKAGLTVITFGIKLPAGIFIPTLGVGACAGRVVGILMQYLQVRNPDARLFRGCNGDLDCIIPGLYAMIGAAATLSGVTRTTVSLAVIMFELTDTLTYAVPIMLAVLVAKTVADALEPKGIYDLVIDLSQLPYLDAKHDPLWSDYHVSDVIDREVETIRLDRTNTVKSLRDQLESILASGNEDSGFPILRKDGSGVDDMRLIGYIGANELEHALSIVADDAEETVHFHSLSTHTNRLSGSFGSLVEPSEYERGSDPFDFSIYMDQAPLTVTDNSPLEMVHQFFVKLGARYVIVTDPDGYYEGVIDKKTWLAFLSELEERS